MFGRKRKKVEALELSAIGAGVVKRHGWEPDRAKRAENEYRKYLYLLMLYPGSILTPWDDDLDLFWHEHILHTQQYAADCQTLFGRFINHDPTISASPANETKAQNFTAQAYFETFGRKAQAGDSWLLPTSSSVAAVGVMSPAAAKKQSSCAATSTVVSSCGSSHSSCSGGHSSCGGHGCGGGGH
jgi:hypothetical protein